MAINTDMVSQTFDPFVCDYAFRNLELFTLGCGAGIDGKNGLGYLNEHDERGPKLEVLLMFGAMLIIDSEMTRTIDYEYNYAGSLHWGFDIRFHRPIMKMSDRLGMKVKLGGLYDRGEGRGLLAQHIGDTYDSEGNLPFTNEPWNCLVYDGGWGSPKPPKNIADMLDRPVDVEITKMIPESQTLIYRLSGDYHPQHIDREYATVNGEPRPILHIIGYAGVIMRHVIDAFVPGEPERITRSKTHITSPVHPRSTLMIRLWKVTDDELRFALVDADADETGAKPHLNWRIIEYK